VHIDWLEKIVADVSFLHASCMGVIASKGDLCEATAAYVSGD